MSPNLKKRSRRSLFFVLNNLFSNLLSGIRTYFSAICGVGRFDTH